MPQPALLPHYSPLCDSNLVGCLDIDARLRSGMGCDMQRSE